MAHDTQTTGDGINLTSEEMKKLIMILNHKDIEKIIGYEEPKE